eukprot:TRINITY_DN61052_c0_g1_i1.p1 TRINITY_DN61052_c0_g1~~TRINITY_DN61052_c0_g1_i1.p1  ORF type:complete len:1076 (-),score=159.44 TRINITY_DN61052_c0_g1_i1:136-3363(-)
MPWPFGTLPQDEDAGAESESSIDSMFAVGGIGGVDNCSSGRSATPPSQADGRESTDGALVKETPERVGGEQEHVLMAAEHHHPQPPAAGIVPLPQLRGSSTAPLSHSSNVKVSTVNVPASSLAATVQAAQQREHEHASFEDTIERSVPGEAASQQACAVGTVGISNANVERIEPERLGRAQETVPEGADEDDVPPVQVCIRMRPLLPWERAEGQESNFIQMRNSGRGEVTLLPKDGSEPADGAGGANPMSKESARTFRFDRAFSPETSQQEICDQMRLGSLVGKVVKGFHATLFAYGQTGSGKTFSMEGFTYDHQAGRQAPSADMKCPRARVDTTADEQLGIIPRAIRSLFASLERERGGMSAAVNEGDASSNENFCVKVSFLQIYKENVYDLLNVAGQARGDEGASLRMRWDSVKGQFFLENLFEYECTSADEVLDHYAAGVRNKKMATTCMNTASSRSHAVLMLTLVRRTRIDYAGGSDESVAKPFREVVSKLTLVDLAGSERAATANSAEKAEARFREAVNINSSLFILRRVITSLAKQKGDKRDLRHVPYRESKLTSLLQHSLGGNGYLLMMACLSPSDKYYEENLSTLQYAAAAASIKNNPCVNLDPKDRIIHHLQLQLDAAHAYILREQSLDTLPEELLKLAKAGPASGTGRRVGRRNTRRHGRHPLRSRLQTSSCRQRRSEGEVQPSRKSGTPPVAMTRGGSQDGSPLERGEVVSIPAAPLLPPIARPAQDARERRCASSDTKMPNGDVHGFKHAGATKFGSSSSRASVPQMRNSVSMGSLPPPWPGYVRKSASAAALAAPPRELPPLSPPLGIQETVGLSAHSLPRGSETFGGSCDPPRSALMQSAGVRNDGYGVGGVVTNGLAATVAANFKGFGRADMWRTADQFSTVTQDIEAELLAAESHVSQLKSNLQKVSVSQAAGAVAMTAPGAAAFGTDTFGRRQDEASGRRFDEAGFVPEWAATRSGANVPKGGDYRQDCMVNAAIGDLRSDNAELRKQVQIMREQFESVFAGGFGARGGGGADAHNVVPRPDMHAHCSPEVGDGRGGYGGAEADMDSLEYNRRLLAAA